MEIIVATHNQGKLREFQRILAPIRVIGMQEAGVTADIAEDGTTFAENAEIKAAAVHRLTGKPVVADDSGLCVDYLGGRPGVYSARYGGESLPYPQKLEMLLEELEGVPNRQRTARFTCAICYIDETGRRYTFEESCEGRIGFEPLGENGFGYDPVFMIGENSFAQLTDEQKDAISHRGKALRALRGMV